MTNTDVNTETTGGGRSIRRRALVAGTAWAVPAIAIAAPAQAFSLSGPVTATGCAEKLQGASCAPWPTQGYRFYFVVHNPPIKDACIVINRMTVGGDVTTGDNGVDITDLTITTYTGDAGSVCGTGCCGGSPSICVSKNSDVRFAITGSGNNSSNTNVWVDYTVYDADDCSDGGIRYSVQTGALSTPSTHSPCDPYSDNQQSGCV